MPKYRANESRDKLAWLCRVQPIFNEVNRDRGRQGQPTNEARAEIKLALAMPCKEEEDEIIRWSRGETDVWANRNHGYTA